VSLNTYTPEELKTILDAHYLWLKDSNFGARADLSSANLRSANLSSANLRSADLSFADLRFADLRSADLRSADLSSADLSSANLSSADLSSANLRFANLSFANLSSANLSSADLSSAVKQHAKVQSLHRRILAAIEAGGELNMSNWHRCETTHCRAGWAIHLAGPAGAILEACVGPVVAGALIHTVSCPQLEGKIPDFYAGNTETLADIRRLAELEPPLETVSE
jgi:hypothetical protein